jgi:lectin-like protein/putative metal-binding protein
MTPPRHATKSAFLALQNVAHFVNPWTPMRLWLAASSMILAGACVAETHRGGRQEPDAGVGDDAACATPQTFFEDHDGDGHGDMALSVQACTQPAGTVTVGDDCDDTDATRHPGATDVCDGVDNDCSAATAETCPTGCTAVRRPPPDEQHIYLFCSAATNWVAASANCATAGTGFHLVEIDSQAENDFVRTTATNLLGNVEIHIGANDRAVENSWVWDGGELFWSGGVNGSAFMGRFQTWLPGGEPNAADGNGNGADCGELRTDNRWYDSNCNDNQRYVCRQ